MNKSDYLIIIFESIICIPVGLWSISNALNEGYFYNIPFILGAAYYIILVFYIKRVWEARDKYRTYTIIFAILHISILIFVPIILGIKFLLGGAISFIPLYIRGIYEVLYERPKLRQPPNEKLKIYLTQKRVIRENLSVAQHFRIEGFNQDSKLLASLIREMLDGKSLAAYIYYEYPRGGASFESYGVEHAIFFPEGKSLRKRRAVCYDCRSQSFLEVVTHSFWTWKRDSGGDYLSFFLPFEDSFQEVADKMDKRLYRDAPPDALYDLLVDHEFLIRNMKRNREMIRDMELITIKLNAEDLVRRLSKTWPTEYILNKDFTRLGVGPS